MRTAKQRWAQKHNYINYKLRAAQGIIRIACSSNTITKESWEMSREINQKIDALIDHIRHNRTEMPR